MFLTSYRSWDNNGGMNHETLAALAEIPAATLRGWVHKGILRPEQPASWNLAESLAVCIVAELVRDGLTLDRARAETVSITVALGAFIRVALQAPSPVSEAKRLVFVRAVLPPRRGDTDPELVERLVTSDDDVARLVAYLLKRQAVQLELRDVGAAYCTVLEAFKRERQGKAAEQRQRVTA
jgi:hypothetical protein